MLGFRDLKNVSAVILVVTRVPPHHPGASGLDPRYLIGIHGSGQIIATSHDQKPQEVAEKGKSPYFREI